MYSNTPPTHGYPNQQPPGSGYPAPDYMHNSQGPPPSNVPQQDYVGRHHQPPPSSAPPVYYPPQHAQPGVPPQGYGGGSSHTGGIPTAFPMDSYTVNQFVSDTQPGAGTFPFEVDKTRTAMLQVNFGCQSSAGGSLKQIYMKKGTMIAYRGDIKFEREGVMEHGMVHMLKKAVTSEGAQLVKAKAIGDKAQLYLADNNKMITVLQLQGESITVNGDDLLAFEPTLKHEIEMLKSVAAMVSGGLFNVRLSGRGCVAILSHGKPLTLVVKKGQPPVYTDPEATVAWSGNLKPEVNTDVQFKTLFGRGSGDSFQMKFDPRRAEGFVVVQPYEEIGSSGG